jgi:hypothetical protein
MRRGFVVAAGCLAVSAATFLLATAAGGVVGSPGSAAANRIIAGGVARRELDVVTAPVGAVLTSPSVGVGSRGAGTLLTDAYDYYRSWRASGDPKAFIDSIIGHPPAGFAVPGDGYSGTNGRIDDWSVSLSLRRLPRGLYQEGVDVDAAVAKGGGMTLRVDSWAAWLVPRPSWERIPAAIRTVAVSEQPGVGSYPAGTVTATSKIQKLTSLIDHLQIEQPGPASACPVSVPSFALRFSRAGDSRPVARVAEDGCFGLAFSSGGRRGPLLAEHALLAGVLWRMRILPRCQTVQLAGSAATPQQLGPRAGSGLFMRVDLNEVDRRACGLAGYPTVRLLSADGTELPTHVKYPGGPFTLAIAAPTQPIQLFILWSRARRSCRGTRAVELAVTPAHSGSAVVIPIGSAKHPVAPCHGKITVSSGP